MDKELKEMENGYFRIICYLDILGFSTKIMQYNINQKSNIYNDILKKVKVGAVKYYAIRLFDSEGYPKGPVLLRIPQKYTDVAWFSDTIVIYSQVFNRTDSDRKKICSLFERSKDLFMKLLLKGFPVRGGITVGSFYVDKKKIFM